MGRAVTKDLQAFKRSYAQRPCIRDAALAAGYSQSVANRGITHLPKQLRTFLAYKQRQLHKLEILGKSITAEQQKDVVRGGLLANVAEGKDKAVNSLKLLGQDKAVALFTPDSLTGVIVIRPPRALDLSGISNALANTQPQLTDNTTTYSQESDKK